MTLAIRRLTRIENERGFFANIKDDIGDDVRIAVCIDRIIADIDEIITVMREKCEK